MSLILALLTVLSWGLWIVVAEGVAFSSIHIRNLYVSLVCFIVALIVYGQVGLVHADTLSASMFWPSFAGGILWIASSWCAYQAIEGIGLTKAIGIWAPGNIVTSMLWGHLLFGENFLYSLSGLSALVVVLIGVGLIVFKGHNTENHQKESRTGVLFALCCAFLWGSYFIPIQYFGLSPWAASLPMTFGMLAGATLFAIPDLKRRFLLSGWDSFRVFLSGGLWSLGNYSSLLLMERVGTGLGFTIAQMAIVINALAGIYLFKRPAPGTPSARLAFLGIALALSGVFILGQL